MIFNPILIFLPPPLIWLKFRNEPAPAFRLWAGIPLNCGWLKMLKASSRYSSLKFSLTRKTLKKLISKLIKPFECSVFRPRVAGPGRVGLELVEVATWTTYTSLRVTQPLPAVAESSGLRSPVEHVASITARVLCGAFG